MAPRASWRGCSSLSLVSCAVALFPATTTRGRARFNIINRQTGDRARCEVDKDDYKVERTS
jgi:DNA end-binding protein Ku